MDDLPHFENVKQAKPFWLRRRGCVYELPRPRFREWLFGIRPSFELVLERQLKTENDEPIDVRVAVYWRGYPQRPSRCWPSDQWEWENRDSNGKVELPGAPSLTVKS